MQAIRPGPQNRGPFPGPVLPGPGPAPFRPLDFPPLSKVIQAGGVDVAASLLVTTLAVAAVTTVLRAPLYHTLPQQPAPFEYRVPNLLTSTLAPAKTPFIAGDLRGPLPVTPAPTWQPQRNLLLTAVPFRPAELTPPSAAARVLSFEFPNSLVGVLTGQSRPFKPIDVVPPVPAKALAPFDLQNLLTTVLAPAQASPFTPVDFGALQPLVRFGEFTPPNLLISTLAQQQAVPFIPVDFPALPKVFGPQDYQAANLLTGVLLGQIQPFNQLSWPALTPATLRPDSPAGENLALTIPQPKPFNQLDWPPLLVPLSGVPFLIPNTTIHQVAAPAPPNLHKLYYDVSSGRLFWRVSKTANPIEIIPL